MLGEVAPALLGRDVLGDHRPRLLLALGVALVGLLLGGAVVVVAAAIGNGLIGRRTSMAILVLVTFASFVGFGWRHSEHRRCSMDGMEEICVPRSQAFVGAGFFAAVPGLLAIAALAAAGDPAGGREDGRMLG